MEIFVPVKGHSQYVISESGTIKRIEGGREQDKVVRPWFNKVKGKEYPNGYMYATFMTKDDIDIKGNPINYPYYKGKGVHRILAEAFIPNPENKPQVNHKDRNKLNNSLDNLEWATVSENIQHSYDNGRNVLRGADHWRTGVKTSIATKYKQSICKLGDKHPKFSGVYYVFFRPYNSSIEAYKATNICSRTIIRRCKKGKPGTDYYFVPKVIKNE